MLKKSLFLILVSAVFLTGCTAKPQPNNNLPLPTPTVTQAEVSPTYTFVAETDGQTAADLLQANLTLETKDYGEAGLFITAINGLAGDNQNYWAFYLNDQYAQTGISQTVLKKGDKITLVYEKIVFDQLSE